MSKREISPELKAVREHADELGIKYHHLAGVASIQESIDRYLKAVGTQEAEDAEDVPLEQTEEEYTPMNSLEYKEKYTPERKRAAGRLIRCRIQCMNPQKREWEGEIVSVGSAKLGTFKKFIPFDGREYHVPQIIFDHLKERQCSVFYSVPDPRDPRQKIRKARLVKEFSIEVLPPLTKDELKELARQQAMAESR